LALGAGGERLALADVFFGEAIAEWGIFW